MTKLNVEVACLTDLELEIQSYDINKNGGIGYDEFVLIA